MGIDGLVDVGREAMTMALTIMSPLLVLGLAVALLMGMLQTITNVHDPTISLVPRILAMLVTLMACLPWLVGRMMEFSQAMFSHVPISGGG